MNIIYRYLGIGFFLLFPMLSYAQTGIVCEQKYALCTSAPCLEIPGSDNKALCFCKVETGKSFGTVPCDQRKPSTGKHGEQQIVSTFSLKELSYKKGLICPSGTPWTNCLNMPCIVDPNNPDKAVCSCKINRTGKYFTMGGNCDPKSCKTMIWSAATPGQFHIGANSMMKALGLTELPGESCETAAQQ